MKKTATASRTLKLCRETLRRLDGARLAQAKGGTDLVTVDDPITRSGALTCQTCDIKR